MEQRTRRVIVKTWRTLSSALNVCMHQIHIGSSYILVHLCNVGPLCSEGCLLFDIHIRYYGIIRGMWVRLSGYYGWVHKKITNASVVLEGATKFIVIPTNWKPYRVYKIILRGVIRYGRSVDWFWILIVCMLAKGIHPKIFIVLCLKLMTN